MAKREGLSHEEFINQSLEEINLYFEKGVKPNRKEIKARLDGFAHIYIGGKKYITGGEKYEQPRKNPIDNEIKGITGYKGYVKGKVKIIHNESELKDLKDNPIIVTDTLSTTAAQYLNNVKGIITNHGGIICHAAIISRELGIPSIIGTKTATDVFNDGDEVELDANNGIARVLRREKKFNKIFGITMGLCRADLYMPTHVFNTSDVIGRGHNDIVFKVKDGKISGYFSEDVREIMGKAGLKVLSSKDFVIRNQREVEEVGKDLWAYSEYAASLPLKYMSNQEILLYYNALFDKIQKMFGYFNVSQPHISFALEDEIARKMGLLGLSSDTQYEILEKMLKQDQITMIEEEEKGLIKIALKIKADKNSLELFSKPLNSILYKLNHLTKNLLLNEIILHEDKYSFLASSENFDEFDRKYFIERLKELIKKPVKELNEEIKQKTPSKISLEILRSNIIKKHRLPENLVHFIDVSRLYSHQRMLIRICWTKAVNVWGKFLREFARRMDIGEVDIQYLLREEVNNWLQNNNRIDELELKKRRDLAIFGIFDRGKPFLLTGEEAIDFERKYLTEKVEEGIVKGTVASKGFKKGRVKILDYGKNMVKQIEDMKNGDILVTGNTRPDMILALKKASAVVTNEGGICSHAALVARELGIPCIVGTRYATEVFKDGDIVEVDAEKGTIKRI